MGKLLLLFVVIWSLLILGISVWQMQSSSDKWHIVKTFVYGGVIAFIAIAIMVFIVVMF